MRAIFLHHIAKGSDAHFLIRCVRRTIKLINFACYKISSYINLLIHTESTPKVLIWRITLTT